MALRTTEAEYMAACKAAKECVYIRGLHMELYENCEPIIIHNNNQGTNMLVYNLVFHKRTKYISIKYHYVRQLAEHNQIIAKYLCTEKMPADVLTKSL